MTLNTPISEPVSNADLSTNPINDLPMTPAEGVGEAQRDEPNNNDTPAADESNGADPLINDPNAAAAEFRAVPNDPGEPRRSSRDNKGIPPASFEEYVNI